MDAIREAGDIVAHMRGLGFIPAEIHHMTTGGKHGQKRLGHLSTIGLNSWSHRGVPLPGWSRARCREVFGPSYALEPRLFREQVGDDATLLAYQDELIGWPIAA